MKKYILKTILFCVIFISLVSCSRDKNSLTKENVLEYLKKNEAGQPIEFTSGIPLIFIKSKSDLEKTIAYYSKLHKEGYINAILRSDIPNPETSNRPYKVVLTDKAKPYILETDADGVAKVITLEFNAVDVKDIRILSAFKAEVDVLYKKTKTPFHNINGKDVSKSGKVYPEDTYIKTLEFRKNKNTYEWKHPIKIRF